MLCAFFGTTDVIIIQNMQCNSLMQITKTSETKMQHDPCLQLAVLCMRIVQYNSQEQVRF